MNRSSTAGIFIRRSGQSLVEDDDVDSDDEDADDDPASPLELFSLGGAVVLFSSLPLSSVAFLLPAALERRSFFAQPEPLKTMVGGAKALRIGPDPHSGQASGAGSLTPWMTSKRRPHAAQM
ncbi:MAG TPA: hypothetical protein VFN41_00540 [Candidatus Limnocylindrales bacterium]|nr:hypothetical protein [Candidatus Limnocylindrales bacterium]